MVRIVKKDEKGQSLVELAMLVPFLVLFAFGGIDLGRAALMANTASTAANNLAATVQASPATTQQEAQDWLAAHYPNLGGARAAITWETPSSSTYTHRIWSEADSSFVERQSTVTSRRADVTVTIDAKYITPIGDLLSTAGGGDMGTGFHCESHGTAYVDQTIGGW